MDTKVTKLGYVQRGGAASVYDRVLGARMGSEAVLALMRTSKDDTPVVIAIRGNETCYIPLKESVEKSQLTNQAIRDKNFKTAEILRGPSFGQNLETYIKMSKLTVKEKSSSKVFNLGVINVGSPTSGVNSVVRAFVRQAISKCCKGLNFQK